MATTYAKRLRNWFFTTVGDSQVNGFWTRFVGGGQSKPSESTLSDLVASAAFHAEPSSAAQTDTTAALQDKQGLVILASDVNAKAGSNTALGSTGGSVVVKPSQLPTVESTTNDFTVTTVAADGVNSATQDPFEIVADAGTTSRNKYIVKFKAAFVKWLLRRVLPAGGTTGQAVVKTSNTDFDFSWATVAAGSSGDTYKTTSSSTQSLVLGASTFTVPAGLAYTKGVRVRATNAANSSEYIEGIVSSYSGTTLNFVSDVVMGTGSVSSWVINIGGDIPSQTVSGVPNLYVSDLSGNDTTGDGSINKPFKTIAKAVTVVSNNQTIVIFGGSYTNSTNVVKNTGINYTLYCFPGVVVTQTGTPFYDSFTASSKVDIYGEPSIIQDGFQAFIVYEIAKLYLGKISSQSQGMTVYSKGTDLGGSAQSSSNTVISVKEAVYNTTSAPFIKFLRPSGSGAVPNGTIIASFGSLEYTPQTGGATITGANYIEIADPYSLSLINTFAQWRGNGIASGFTIVKFTGTPAEVSLDNFFIRLGGTGVSGTTRAIDLGAVTILKNLFRNVYVSINPVTAFLTGSASQVVNVENVLLPSGSGVLSGSVTINASTPSIANTRVYVSPTNTVASIATRV